MRAMIEEGLTQGERAFNVLGGIPVAAIVSGALRIVIGKIQIVAGGIFALIGAGIYCWKNDLNPLEIGAEHMVHGTLNMGRGLAEMLLGITVVGSLIPFTCQLLTDPTFHPRFAYSTQRIKHCSFQHSH